MKVFVFLYKLKVNYRHDETLLERLFHLGTNS